MVCEFLWCLPDEHSMFCRTNLCLSHLHPVPYQLHNERGKKLHMFPLTLKRVLCICICYHLGLISNHAIVICSQLVYFESSFSPFKPIIYHIWLQSHLYLLVIINGRLNWWAPDKWWVGNNYLWAQCTVHRMHSFTQVGKNGSRNFNVSSFSSLGNKNVD